ncbi:MAG: hypothetical protein A2746_00455 [Candidatus Yanofskybacteria bacterium RIFCSPHIGHO2_01_FULL_44_22]|uniref:Uncharacterized protein n=1 Tax=Candidatus Yanofskybacteria bacterium RIFCSPHIGHO2_01_FULL_44_22 TaxID=1802669 RepID=A0A1F8F0W7_9BACT|nr:MAG: hypothetical protein A2746_00455 [Candidatus Yanofskybacteria bacterium RIFCSPHIGHO2_01_FULL_44_22]
MSFESGPKIYKKGTWESTPVEKKTDNLPEQEEDQKVKRFIKTPEGLKEVPWGQPIETKKEKEQTEELETWENALEKAEEEKAA